MSEQYKIVQMGGLDVKSIGGIYDNVPSYLKKILVADLDGCIRNGEHRINLLPTKEDIDATGDKPNLAFTEFNEQSHLDTPVQSIIDMVNLMWENGYYVIVLTSCTHSAHTLTTLLDQLERWEVGYDAVVMRGKDNHRWPTDFKRCFMHESGILSIIHNVMTIDDSSDNYNMFKELGCLSLKV